MELNIICIYPELLNMYGDKGNILTLTKRLLWRDIKANVTNYSLNDEIDINGADIVYIGGGGDKEILLAKDQLIKIKDKLKDYIENDGVLLAVCSGFELLGEYFYLKGEKTEGLGILNLKAEWNDKTFVSDVVIDTPFGKISGFENHNGRMNTSLYEPLGKIIFGNGNNGEDEREGLIYKNTFATYLDGPVLPKNPNLCDEILKRALNKKYNDVSLEKLDDTDELKAQNYIIEKYKN